MSFRMEKAVRKDIDALCVLMTDLAGHEISPEDMKDRLDMIEKSQIDRLFVCIEGSLVVGLLGFRIRENPEEVSRFGEISAIDVLPEYRKKGVGRYMMEYADKQARKLGCKGMWLVSDFGLEEEAHQFYQRLGYQTNGYRFVRLF